MQSDVTRLKNRSSGEGPYEPVIRSVWNRTNFWLRYVLCQKEDARRKALTLGPIADIGLLSAALTLPKTAIGPVKRQVERMAHDLVGAGLVTLIHDVDGDLWGNRIGDVPLTPIEAVVRAGTLLSGFHRSEPLAGYVGRTVLVPSSVHLPMEQLVEAELYGIGVRRGKSVDASELVVPPGIVAPNRVTPEWWDFCERMYAAHLEAAGQKLVHFNSLNQL